MNRLWVRLWLGIMGAFGGTVLAFEVAEMLAGVLVRGLSGSEAETAALTWGTVGGVFLSALLAALIAWYLARPLSAVSRAARQVAGGDLSARALLPVGSSAG